MYICSALVDLVWLGCQQGAVKVPVFVPFGSMELSETERIGMVGAYYCQMGS